MVQLEPTRDGTAAGAELLLLLLRVLLITGPPAKFENASIWAQNNPAKRNLSAKGRIVRPPSMDGNPFGSLTS
jgi:hypothetical protein